MRGHMRTAAHNEAFDKSRHHACNTMHVIIDVIIDVSIDVVLCCGFALSASHFLQASEWPVLRRDDCS